MKSFYLFNQKNNLRFEKENLVTVWSAPNYCYRCGNFASILAFDDNLEKKFIVFNSVP